MALLQDSASSSKRLYKYRLLIAYAVRDSVKVDLREVEALAEDPISPLDS
jgi:hypothetical protein